LGQVIKDFKIRPWWDIDFCSKFAVHVGSQDGFDGWYIMRDPIKCLETKHFYTGTNPVLK